jgi:hypothetical protein
LTDNAGVLDGTLYFWTHNTSIGIGVSNPGSGTLLILEMTMLRTILQEEQQLPLHLVMQINQLLIQISQRVKSQDNLFLQ